MEASNAKKDESVLADEVTRSPAVLASHGSVSVVNDMVTAVEQRSFHDCSCVENTSSVSPTHHTHCLLNSTVYTVMSSIARVEMMNRNNASGESDRHQGLFMLLPPPGQTLG